MMATTTIPDRIASPVSAQAAPRPTGLFEMVLEVADLAASERFYREVIGLPVAARWDDERPAVWLALGREGFLGLWPPETGGAVAIHGGRGGSHVHFALRLPLGTLDATRDRLAAPRLRDRGARLRPRQPRPLPRTTRTATCWS